MRAAASIFISLLIPRPPAWVKLFTQPFTQRTLFIYIKRVSIAFQASHYCSDGDLYIHGALSARIGSRRWSRSSFVNFETSVSAVASGLDSTHSLNPV